MEICGVSADQHRVVPDLNQTRCTPEEHCCKWPKADERRLSASEGRADVPLRRREDSLKEAANVAFLCFADVCPMQG